MNNDILEEEEDSIHQIEMDKIKPSMIAMGNNLIQGGILGIGSSYFGSESPANKDKKYRDRADSDEDGSFERKINKLLKKKSGNYSSKPSSDFLLFGSPSQMDIPDKIEPKESNLGVISEIANEHSLSESVYLKPEA